MTDVTLTAAAIALIATPTNAQTETPLETTPRPYATHPTGDEMHKTNVRANRPNCNLEPARYHDLLWLA